MKRFIVAMDSFKGTMDAEEVCNVVSAGIKRRIPEAQVFCIPMADGGEGMVSAYLRVLGGTRVLCTVSNPLEEPIEASYGILPDGSAVMEMAACAGLPLVEGRTNPFRATTKGVGEMLLHAAKSQVSSVLIGLGGSATTDCGIGMAAALGYRFLDASGRSLEPLPYNMQMVRRIVKPDTLPSIHITAACDVDNPLYGEQGAAYIFGPQKGAVGETLKNLDRGLRNMAEIIQKDLGRDIAHVPGSGAAGGLGAALMAFCNATLKPGVALLLDTVDFNTRILSADMVFTGEGRIDGQSVHGKVPVGISRRCKEMGVPCIALCGAIGDGAEAVYAEGITAMFSAVRSASDFETIRRTCHADMEFLTDSVLRLLLSNCDQEV